MNDAYERRFLLLHLGSVLQTVSRLLEHERDDETISELIETCQILADIASLEHVFGGMTVREFANGALHAFCLWPQLLLDEELDRDALAGPVREHLFAGNPQGWAGYAASLRTQVPWFGEDLAGHIRHGDTTSSNRIA